MGASRGVLPTPPPSPPVWPRRLDSIGRRALSTGRLRHERRKISKDIKVGVTSTATFSCSGPSDGDIYFSLVEATSSTVFLSDPLDLNHKASYESTVLTPSSFTSMLARFPCIPQQQSFETQDGPRNIDAEQIVISVQDLNGLVATIANTALVRSSLKKSHQQQFISQAASVDTCAGEQSTLYALPNKQFLNPPSQDDLFDVELTSSQLGAVTLTGSSLNAHGLHSSSHKTDLDVERTGPKITMSNKTKHAAKLHVVPGKTSSDPVKVVVQVVSTALNFRTKKAVDYMSVELDVTESFIKAALAELAAHAQRPREAISVATEPELKSDALDESDWMALADELLLMGETSDLVDAILAKLRNLNAQTCTMQTLTLMSELARLHASSIDYLIVQPKLKDSDKKWHDRILAISQTMAAKLEDMDSCGYMTPTRTAASRLFLRKVCGMVTAHAHQSGIYSVSNAEDLIHRFDCVPLWNAPNAKPYAWVVLVQPTFTHWQLV